VPIFQTRAPHEGRSANAGPALFFGGDRDGMRTGKKPADIEKLRQKFLQVYAKKSCSISQACTAIGISRTTFYEWKKVAPGFAQAVDEIDEALIDNTESRLMKQINKDNIQAIIFHLRTKGQRRGYVEKQQIDTNLSGELVIKWQSDVK